MKKMSDFAALLSTSSLFAKLPEDVLDEIASLCKRQRLAKGAVLFEKGDDGDSLYGVRRGAIRIETGTEGGEKLTLNILGPGDIFGEIALLDGHPRTADATAAEDCEVIVLRRSDFRRFIEQHPRLALQLLDFLCERLRWMSERVEEIGLLPLKTRIARRLLGLARDFGTELLMTQNQLSEFVGAARENVSRQLQVWRKDGLLDLRRGRIIILDSARLLAEARQGGLE